MVQHILTCNSKCTCLRTVHQSQISISSSTCAQPITTVDAKLIHYTATVSYKHIKQQNKKSTK